MSFRIVLDSHAWRDYEEIEAYFLGNGLGRLLPEFGANL